MPGRITLAWYIGSMNIEHRLTPEQRKAITVAYTNKLRQEAQAITNERIEHDRRVSRTWFGRLWVRLRDSVAV